MKQYDIGEFIIGIPNEWEDMVVGKIVGIMGDSDIPIVEDLITGQELIIFNALVPYSYEALELLCKLNPYERWNIVTRFASPIKDKPKINTGQLLTYSEYINKIHQTRLTK